MTATNHALTGAAIGLIVANPLLAVPAAFISHFVLDSLPHYGPSNPDTTTRTFKNYLVTDALLCVLLVALLAVSHPINWLIAAICAFVATSPDFMWVKDFVRAHKGLPRNLHKRAAVVRLHAHVQWFQRPIGAVVEIAWCAGAIMVLLMLTRS